MNVKTNLFEEYVNFVDNTKKQNKSFKIFIFLIAIIMFFYSSLISISQMNNSFSLQQLPGTGNLDPSLISRQYKLDLMSKFM